MNEQLNVSIISLPISAIDSGLLLKRKRLRKSKDREITGNKEQTTPDRPLKKIETYDWQKNKTNNNGKRERHWKKSKSIVSEFSE